MQSKNNKKSDRKIAIIATVILTIIIIGSLSVYFTAKYYPDIMDNLFENNVFKDKTIEEGDCVDVNYIGRFAENGTIFESSYEDVEQKTGGTPLNIFVTTNASKQPPEGFEAYTSSFIEGLIEGLPGLKEGETYTIGEIPPEKAYGANKLGLADTFYTQNIAIGLNILVEVINMTEDNITLYWSDADNLENFTMPQYIVTDFGKIAENENEAVAVPPPFFLWAGETKVLNVSEKQITVKLMPTKSEDLVETITPFNVYNTTSEGYVFPNKTNITWDEQTITFTHNVEVGQSYNYPVEFFGSTTNVTFTIENVTDEKINLSKLQEGADVNTTTYAEIDKVLTFNRTYIINRSFAPIPFIITYQGMPLDLFSYFFSSEIAEAGLSMNELAGETLIFEVEIVNVYKHN